MGSLGLGLAVRRGPHGGAGPVIPAWVTALRAPSGDLPSIALDFKNGRYWNGTSESADPLSCLREDTDWALFDPATIIPGSGMGCSLPQNNCAPVIIDALAAPLLVSGITTVIVGNVVDAGQPIEVALDIELDQLPDFNTQYNCEYFCKVGAYTGPSAPVLQVFNQSDGIVENAATPTTAGLHKSASTLTTARCDWALDGVAKTGITPTVTPSSPWTNICLQTNTDSNGGDPTPTPSFMELAVIYPPQPVGDLIALSTP